MEHEFGMRNQAAQQCLDRPQTAGSTSHLDGSTAQCAVHHADADGGAAGGSPAADPDTPGKYPGVHGSSGHEGELRAAGSSELLQQWLDQTQALNQKTYRAMESILTEMKAEHKRDGNQRDEFTRELSAIWTAFRDDTQEAIASL